MAQIADLLKRFPRHELAIRRRYAYDATFRTICQDYSEALRAFRYWQSTGAASDDQLEQYRQLLIDLEDEVSTYIDHRERYRSGL